MARAYIAGFSIKCADETKHGAPVEWTPGKLAQLFADIEFIKKKDGISVRKVCEVLPKKNGYGPRWGSYNPHNLRNQYSNARKLLNGPIEHRLILCGGDALISGKNIDLIDAAIEQHALKI